MNALKNHHISGNLSMKDDRKAEHNKCFKAVAFRGVHELRFNEKNFLMIFSVTSIINLVPQHYC